MSVSRSFGIGAARYAAARFRLTMVATVIVDGRVVIDAGRLQTVPGEEILAAGQRAAEQVWSRLRELIPGA